jgi:hypothetical protein
MATRPFYPPGSFAGAHYRLQVEHQSGNGWVTFTEHPMYFQAEKFRDSLEPSDVKFRIRYFLSAGVMA